MKVFGKNVFNELRNNVKSIKKVYLAKNFTDKDIVKFIQDNKISYSVMDAKKMDAMVEGRHQGIIVVVDEYEYVNYETMLNDNIVVMLDHLEDPHNFGAIIRTCEAAGVDAIIIPKRRGVEINSTVMKVSAGALNNINIVEVSSIAQTIDKLKDFGYWVYGTDMDGETYTNCKYDSKTCLVIGAEGNGISKLVHDKCDFIISIPMVGKINSLNASVAAGITIYEVVRQRSER